MKWGRLQVTVWEQVVVVALSLVLLASFAAVVRGFYVEHTAIQPDFGGQIVEGAYGNWGDDFVINPLFSQALEADIASLVFDSLLRYDPTTGQICL